jgi:hypothetical protein
VNYNAIAKLAASCYKIPEREDAIALVKLRYNPIQKRFTALCNELQRRKRRVRVIVLKPRRVGITILNVSYGVSFAFALANMAGVTMANKLRTGQSHMTSAILMANGLPYRSGVIPPYQPGKVLSRLVFPHATGESYLETFTARTPDSARGLGYAFMLLDEAAFYPMMAPFTAALPALSESVEHSYCCIVSTANGKIGKGKHFYEYWKQAGNIDEPSDNEFVRFFAPWTEDPTAKADIKIAADAPRDDEEKRLIKFGVAREQIAWRRVQIATKYKGLVEDFQIENPYTPEEAFIATGYPAFAQDELAFLTSTVKPPVYNGEFTKDARGRITFETKKDGRWKIWENPQPGDEYYIGVDAARGMDVDRPEAPPGDFSAIIIFNGSTGHQAARFADRTHPRITANEVDKAGRFYQTPEIAADHFALLNVELTGNLGRELQRELRDVYFYPRHRFARWMGRNDRVTTRPGLGIGWDTTAATRDMMFSSLRNGLHDEICFIHDDMVMEQAHEATMEDTGWEVTRGHDDALVATMLCWVTVKQNPPRRIHDAGKRAYETYGRTDPSPDRLPYLDTEVMDVLERDWNRQSSVRERKENVRWPQRTQGILKPPGVLGGGN